LNLLFSKPRPKASLLWSLHFVWKVRVYDFFSCYINEERLWLYRKQRCVKINYFCLSGNLNLFIEQISKCVLARFLSDQIRSRIQKIYFWKWLQNISRLWNLIEIRSYITSFIEKKLWNVKLGIVDLLLFIFWKSRKIIKNNLDLWLYIHILHLLFSKVS